MNLTIERFDYRGVEYQLRKIECGKKNCRKCPHGPYWYAIVTISGKKPAVRYIGKELGREVASYRANKKALEVPLI